MMMMSAPSSSFHDYLTINDPLPKTESLSPIQTNEDDFNEPLDNRNQNRKRSSTVKRPMNAFLLWARGERKRVSSDGYGVSQTSLSKLLGETWRHMSVEDKQPFLDMAETLKRQHHIDHPDYQFKPKQRSSISNRTITKNHYLPVPQRQSSNMNSSSPLSSSDFMQEQQQILSLASTSDATPHFVQSSVLAMCQAIAPPGSSSSWLSLSLDANSSWFSKLIDQPQPVIVTPPPRTHTSPMSSRRAVRIQIINKHDDIAVTSPTLLPMTPSPLSSSSSSSIVFDESSPTLIDYLSNTNSMFNIPGNQHELIPLIDETTAYEILHDSSSSHLMDLDHPYDNSGWIDTPLSNLGSNSTDIISTSPYSSYDFLSL
ncbi:unnamed protein product [Rotaria socialis]|uniref:Sex-determining region Y protein n=1 Tax=Rotaria socialis TaxID=392032 RepID=A0A820G874_9BILA|nr:unnamed protein product [Rotaria socialis]CAF3249464.1 unnamed protein product [Rotaria socialis]CAF3419646.1 unnamed protein product [Rotaria socialis]CAF3702264.1 unnamed protein product [Rotaria socialis]CAF4273771.1 unnamed protein product [Rotaria socialis]